MDQEPAKCNKVYVIATYKRRQVCVKIKKYRFKQPPDIQIRVFAAKKNGALKQVAYVNYTPERIQRIVPISVDFKFVENCIVQ